MPKYEFDVPNVCPGALMDELNADGIQPECLQSRDNLVWVTVPAVLEPQVSAVVEAHDGPAAFEAVAWEDVRVDRNGRLSGSDWTALADSPLSEVEEAAWFAYRQSLRDVPQDHDDPTDITWPEPPS
jgi:hypothetical protein